MTRAELKALLTALFGSLAEAAAALETSPDTISKWGRDNPVPAAVAVLLRVVAADRGISV